MGYRHFRVPHGTGAEAVERELNQFLAQATILGLERQFSESGWCYSVEFTAAARPGKANGAEKPGATSPEKGKVDWREILPAPEFAVFDALRRVRTELFEETGIPRYAIFTNDQLGEMVKRRCRTLADLRTIEGVGDGRVESYGQRMLTVLTAAWGTAAVENGLPA